MYNRSYKTFIALEINDKNDLTKYRRLLIQSIIDFYETYTCYKYLML